MTVGLQSCVSFLSPAPLTGLDNVCPVSAEMRFLLSFCPLPVLSRTSAWPSYHVVLQTLATGHLVSFTRRVFLCGLFAPRLCGLLVPHLDIVTRGKPGPSSHGGNSAITNSPRGEVKGRRSVCRVS